MKPTQYHTSGHASMLNTHGGARKGSGRKSKPPTATISFRVAKDKQAELKSLVSAYIKSLTL